MMRLLLCCAVLFTAALAQRGGGGRGGPQGGRGGPQGDRQQPRPRPGSGGDMDVRPDACGKYQCPAYTTQTVATDMELRSFTTETWWVQVSEVKDMSEMGQEMGQRGPRGRPGEGPGGRPGQGGPGKKTPGGRPGQGGLPEFPGVGSPVTSEMRAKLREMMEQSGGRPSFPAVGGPNGDMMMGQKLRELMAKAAGGPAGSTGVMPNADLMKFLQSRMQKGAGRGRGRRPGMRGMFGKLFRYINGANADGTKMPMTIPVPKKFEPQSDGTMKMTMSFYLADANNHPAPTDADVTVTSVPAGKSFYVKSFLMNRDDAVRGKERFEQEMQALKDELKTQGRGFDETSFYKVGYSAPWVWPKYTEVWLDATA